MGAARYKPYPAYKPSGVEWLGDIPEGWEAKRLGNLFEERREKVSDKDYPPLSVTMQGIVPQLETAAKSLDSDNRKLVKAGDFVINSRSDRKGSAGLSALDGSVTLISNVLKPRDIQGSFAHHLLKSYPFQEEYYRFGKGIVADLWSTNFNSMKNITLPVVPKEEQTKIAAFLDYETGKIDALIAKQERLIALLEEKRQAVISHAVTKGLNPTAPLRPSGIDWLGDVPEHWEVCKLKHVKGLMPNAFVDGPFGSNLKSEHFVQNGDAFVIESNFATTGLINEEDLKQITDKHFSTISRSSVDSGDIVIAKIGARYGSSSILPKLSKKAVVSGNSLKLTVDANAISNSFAAELLGHLKREGAMDENVNVTAQPALSLGGLNNLPFLKVPMSEQQEIVERVLCLKETFDRLSRNTESAITLLKERRTALISAAVTGKIDVRDWQPPQPLSGTDLSTETLKESAL